MLRGDLFPDEDIVMNTPWFVTALRAGRSLPLVVACCSPAALAQRFDNWVAAPNLTGTPVTNVATDPWRGAPTMIVSSATGTDTLGWNGSAFVSLGLTNNPVGGALESLAPYSVGQSVGLVHLDAAGVTSVWKGGPSWITLGVLSPSPSGRNLAAACSVPGPGGEAFLFGGSGATLLQDLWSFDGTVWTNRTPGGALPAARAGAVLSPDGGHGLVLHGGAGASVLADLWWFDGQRWTRAGKGPQRAYHASVFDVARQQLLIAGGVDGSATFPNDTWTLPLPFTPPVAGSILLSNWTQVTPSLPFAGLPVLVSAALDTVRSEIVLADRAGTEVLHDLAASYQAYAISPNTNCRTPNLQLLFPPVEPRVPAAGTLNVPIGGLTGMAGVPMALWGEFVVPGPFTPGMPLAGSSCLAFLSSAASPLLTTTTLAGGQYFFNVPIPANPSIVGSVLDHQAFGVFGTQMGASEAARMVIGR